eukprot:1902931-Rhodomonas_salina.2
MGAKREGVRWSWCVTDRPGRMGALLLWPQPLRHKYAYHLWIVGEHQTQDPCPKLCDTEGPCHGDEKAGGGGAVSMSLRPSTLSVRVGYFFPVVTGP